MIRIAIVGFGNVGRAAYDALQNAPDMMLQCVVEAQDVPDMPPEVRERWVKDIADIRTHGPVDAAILCLPSRQCPQAAETLLGRGVHTVDAYDIHTEIWETRCRLDEVAKRHGKTGVIAAGWDPGSDSIVRAMMEAMAPRGLSYTDFGPGMSMGHTVAAKAVEGVRNALSMTMPAGAGVHRRMVYVQLEPDASPEAVTEKIKADPYFAHDETHVIPVEDVGALMDMGHGVEITRKGVSGKAHNQHLAFQMKINNPALTGQILVSAARAVVKQSPGCYTMIEIPPIDMLPGDRQGLIERLV